MGEEGGAAPGCHVDDCDLAVVGIAQPVGQDVKGLGGEDDQLLDAQELVQHHKRRSARVVETQFVFQS